MKQKKTSLWRWLLLFGYGYLAFAGWVRMANSIVNWYWLNVSGITPGPLYLVLTGLLWGVVGLVGAGWVYLQLANWQVVGSAAALVFAVSYWADRLLAGSREGNLPNTLFALALTLLGLGYAVLVLWGRKGDFRGWFRSGN